MLSFLIFGNVLALSWNCDYSCIQDPKSTHVLYKEDNQNVVRWLEKYDYCKRKGEPGTYPDYGEQKCLFSRNICLWDSNTSSCYFDEKRGNDPYSECRALLMDNILEA